MTEGASLRFKMMVNAIHQIDTDGMSPAEVLKAYIDACEAAVPDADLPEIVTALRQPIWEQERAALLGAHRRDR
jgi:hypothetical protein